ncbi:MAG: response regulator [candidate division Zixibacteria bacterium]|nr:response regulator [candidate division Zixibacteria bacterium]
MTNTSLEQLTKLARERGHPYRILIVDDEPWVREVFSDFCALTDAFEVELAATGNEAVDKVKATSYDLITLDLIMPEMSGLDVLTEIKRSSPKVPIMIITGNATKKIVDQAGVLGACRVMYKPIQLDDFITEVSSALTR